MGRAGPHMKGRAGPEKPLTGSDLLGPFTEKDDEVAGLLGPFTEKDDEEAKRLFRERLTPFTEKDDEEADGKAWHLLEGPLRKGLHERDYEGPGSFLDPWPLLDGQGLLECSHETL